MFITIYSEVSIDGKITLARGKSSKELLDYLSKEDICCIHEYRSKVDGILVGMNTIRMDNPSLTCRYGENRKNPIRIIPTVSLDIPEKSTVWNDENETIFLSVEKNREKIGIIESKKKKHLLICGEEKIDFKKAIDILESEYGIHSLMIEGGGEINWTFFDNDLVDKIVLMQIPVIVGGRDNVSFVEGNGFGSIELMKKFKLVNCEMKQDCCLMTYERK